MKGLSSLVSRRRSIRSFLIRPHGVRQHGVRRQSFRSWWFGSLAVAVLLTGATVACAQSTFQPSVGQPGKDVIWVPTGDDLVERMLRMANVGPKDELIDLGSGDGRIVITAAKNFGAHATGIEFNPDMVALAKRNAERAGLTDRANFVKGDLFETDLSPATVITMYLLPSINLKLRPRLLQLTPGTRIVSHDFDLGDWQPDETGAAGHGTAYLWIVPAPVDGSWVVQYDGQYAKEKLEVTFKQAYQMLDGRALRGERASPVSGMMHGDNIKFSITDADGGARTFVGRIHEAAMDGMVTLPGGEQKAFSAAR